jgi:polyhydroxybutyrate depolymerase
MYRYKSLLFSFVLLGTLIQAACRKNNSVDPDDGQFRFSQTLTVDGRERTYQVNLPPTYYQSQGLALVLALHGGGGSAEQFEATNLLTAKANQAGFVVVYPDGLPAGALRLRTWNAGGCCGGAVENNFNDVNFISRLIDKLLADYPNLDPKKVYATGHSNGGMLAYRLACELPNKIAAIAPNACTMVARQCNPARAVPILHLHSENDQHVPYRGGVGNGLSGAYNPPLDSVFRVWAVKNACRTPNQLVINQVGYRLFRWANCQGNANIDFYLTKDGGHAWPGGLPGSDRGDPPATSINANDLLWAFFQQHQLP